MSRTHRPLAFVSLVPLIALALVGCAPPGGTTTGPDLDALSAPVEPVWQISASGIGSDIVVVDDIVLAYTHSDQHPFALTAYSADDGEVLWQRDSTPGGVTTEVFISPTVVQDAAGAPLVAVLTPPEQATRTRDLQRIELLNPGTGEVVHRSSQRWFSRIGACEHNRFVCAATPVNDGDADTDEWDYSAFDYETDEIRLSERVGDLDQFENAQHLTDDVYLVELAAGGFAFSRVEEQKVLWSTPIPEAFDGVDVQSYGAHHDDGAGVILTSIERLNDGDAPATADLFTVVAFSAETGETEWMQQERALCDDAIVCSGSFEVGPTPGWSGRILTGTDVTLSEVDATTGDARWSYTAETIIAPDETMPLPMAPEATTLILTPAGLELINSQTGRTHELAPGELVRCIRPARFEQPMVGIADQDILEYRTGVHDRACDGDLNEIDDPSAFTRSAVQGASTTWKTHDDADAGADSHTHGVFGFEFDFGQGDEADDAPELHVVQTGSTLAAYMF